MHEGIEFDSVQNLIDKSRVCNNDNNFIEDVFIQINIYCHNKINSIFKLFLTNKMNS